MPASYPLSHIEWEVANGEQSAAFLEALFGWSFKRFSAHYRLYEPSDGVAVGLLEKPQPQLLTKVCPVFIEVPDIKATLAEALALDAELIEPITEIANYGVWAKIREPGGNAVGLFSRARLATE